MMAETKELVAADGGLRWGRGERGESEDESGKEELCGTCDLDYSPRADYDGRELDGAAVWRSSSGRLSVAAISLFLCVT